MAFKKNEAVAAPPLFAWSYAARRRTQMTNGHEHERTDDELFAAAEAGLKGHGAVVEAMRRLRNTLDALRRSNDRYSKLMSFLTIVLTILTAVQLYKVFRP
jgi:hypothetical protein